ncbi:MAG: hypothetical protein IJT23_06095 [Clostridia bacterium]|nr:hypothetical protein [Clostridia bacterium]
MQDTLKELLGDDAEDKIKSVIGSLSGGGGGGGAMDMGELAHLASVLSNSNNDNRARLLESLKPYMRENRKKSIDSAIRLLNVSKVAMLLKNK